MRVVRRLLLVVATGMLLAVGASWWLGVRRMKRTAVEFVVATRAGDTATMWRLAAPEVRSGFRNELENRLDPRLPADPHPRAEWRGSADSLAAVSVEADSGPGLRSGMLGFHLVPDIR